MSNREDLLSSHGIAVHRVESFHDIHSDVCRQDLLLLNSSSLLRLISLHETNIADQFAWIHLVLLLYHLSMNLFQHVSKPTRGDEVDGNEQFDVERKPFVVDHPYPPNS